MVFWIFPHSSKARGPLVLDTFDPGAGGVLLLFLLELEVVLVEVLVGLLGRLERLLLSSFASRHLGKCWKEFELGQISDILRVLSLNYLVLLKKRHDFKVRICNALFLATQLKLTTNEQNSRFKQWQ